MKVKCVKCKNIDDNLTEKKRVCRKCKNMYFKQIMQKTGQNTIDNLRIYFQDPVYQFYRLYHDENLSYNMSSQRLHYVEDWI